MTSKFAVAAAAQVTFDNAARAYKDAPHSLEARWTRDRALAALLSARAACCPTRR